MFNAATRTYDGEAVVMTFLNPNTDEYLLVCEEDMRRPDIAVSIIAAAMRLDKDHLEGAEIVYLSIRHFDIGPKIGSGKPFMQWCVTAVIHAADNEIRETAFDIDLNEWVAPWFDFKTGVVHDEQ